MNKTAERWLEIVVVIAALATIPLTIALEHGDGSSWVVLADWAVWAVFLVEYVAFYAAASDRAAYVQRNIFGAVIVVLSFPALPAVLGLIRVARVARIARLMRVPVAFARGLNALRTAMGRPGLVYLAVANVFLILAGGVLLTVFEPEAVKHDLLSGIWLAIVTATTVGYGDITPVTTGGRLVAVVLMLGGVGLVSTLAAAIAAYFVGQDTHAQLGRLGEQMERLEKLLEQSRKEASTEGR
jgi:voltage-gated potassium channel